MLDDIKAMGDIAIYRMRSVSGEAWSFDGRPIGVVAIAPAPFPLIPVLWGCARY